MPPHPPMPPHEPGSCKALLNWDHWCTLPTRHKGPHKCPCGASWEKKRKS